MDIFTILVALLLVIYIVYVVIDSRKWKKLQDLNDRKSKERFKEEIQQLSDINKTLEDILQELQNMPGHDNRRAEG